MVNNHLVSHLKSKIWKLVSSSWDSQSTSYWYGELWEVVFSLKLHKDQTKNKILTKKLESVLRVVLKGPIEDCHKIVNETIEIWKKHHKVQVFIFIL